MKLFTVMLVGCIAGICLNPVAVNGQGIFPGGNNGILFNPIIYIIGGFLVAETALRRFGNDCEVCAGREHTSATCAKTDDEDCKIIRTEAAQMTCNC